MGMVWEERKESILQVPGEGCSLAITVRRR